MTHESSTVCFNLLCLPKFLPPSVQLRLLSAFFPGADARLDLFRRHVVQLGRGHVRVRRRHRDGILGQGAALRLPQELRGLPPRPLRNGPLFVLILLGIVHEGSYYIYIPCESDRVPLKVFGPNGN